MSPVPDYPRETLVTKPAAVVTEYDLRLVKVLDQLRKTTHWPKYAEVEYAQWKENLG